MEPRSKQPERQVMAVGPNVDTVALWRAPGSGCHGAGMQPFALLYASD